MIIQVPLNKIHPNPWQIRTQIDMLWVAELALDIKRNSLLQIPVGRVMELKDGAHQMVGLYGFEGRPTGLAAKLEREGVFVEIAFGHNRLAAFRRLAEEDSKYAYLPVDLRELSDEQMADYAWSENEKRLALNPIERALALQRIIVDFHLSQEQCAEKRNLSRSAVANCLRMLKLPKEIQEDLSGGMLSERQGLALVSLYDLPAELRQKAESEFSPVRPSKILAAAMDGQNADHLRELIVDLARTYDPQKKLYMPTTPMQAELKKTDVPLATAWDYEPAPKTNSSQSTQPIAKLAPGSNDILFSANTQSTVNTTPITAITPAQTFTPTPSVIAAAPAPDPAAPMTWKDSTIQITLTYWPEDGNPRGRVVAMAARANRGAQVTMMRREQEILLDTPMQSLVDEVKKQFKE